MADLKCNTAGIISPNPFWLASAPPTNTGDQIMRAFDAGWGGAVWKTLGEPIVNVWSRYGSVDINGVKMMGLNNIELITDRPLDVNLKEIYEVKKRYPNHAVIVSLMVESKREAWHEIVKKAEDAGGDGLELNFGCPHGMSERGMGGAVGQVPEYIEQITGWVKEVATVPVLVKLTPNIADIRYAARAAKAGGGDGVSLINTINSIIGLDLDTLAPNPPVNGLGSHGGFCGPAVKPIALNMVSQIGTDPETLGLPISGIGGVSTWRDAAEFIALGSSSVQVCTAVMHYGFRIIEDLVDGLSNYLDEKGMTMDELRGASLPKIRDWKELDLNYKVNARIDQEKCIGCGLCYTACEDGAHQAIFSRRREDGRTFVEVKPDACVGCNLCSLVCPVDGCIDMVEIPTGFDPCSWEQYQSGEGKLAPRPAGH
ncbi:NAD-dependent dihydropyrimidine dehydrogenase subunit PreA [Microvenator marinus]|jgi:dihydropyrimidine dehydrogenase (NAD+) subunit PreA|uniref:dihydrouracil dehydrogenase (NAD(+)) n=1 Tax=Microvenator marinus TaxID=2600177 RepID=A0A5B8XUQ4_9DELT|nr:NAD-dependent dihydropyrimidine dehydrogenase subunit PreA [Microvenator marinus]QED28668.1 NAD-dependent dihydropyrimidine dehydrogenase subunit PreA [Microvenator marinus]